MPGPVTAAAAAAHARAATASAGRHAMVRKGGARSQWPVFYVCGNLRCAGNCHELQRCRVTAATAGGYAAHATAALFGRGHGTHFRRGPILRIRFSGHFELLELLKKS